MIFILKKFRWGRSSEWYGGMFRCSGNKPQRQQRWTCCFKSTDPQTHRENHLSWKKKNRKKPSRRRSQVPELLGPYCCFALLLLLDSLKFKTFWLTSNLNNNFCIVICCLYNRKLAQWSDLRGYLITRKPEPKWIPKFSKLNNPYDRFLWILARKLISFLYSTIWLYFIFGVKIQIPFEKMMTRIYQKRKKIGKIGFFTKLIMNFVQNWPLYNSSLRHAFWKSVKIWNFVCQHTQDYFSSVVAFFLERKEENKMRMQISCSNLMMMM